MCVCVCVCVGGGVGGGEVGGGGGAIIANSADPDWFYTVCKGKIYPGSAGLWAEIIPFSHLLQV